MYTPVKMHFYDTTYLHAQHQKRKTMLIQVYFCFVSLLISLCQLYSIQPCHIIKPSHAKLVLMKGLNSHILQNSVCFQKITSLSNMWSSINIVSCVSMLTFIDRKALSSGPYRVIWESGESSSSTWSLSGGSSAGSRGRRVEAVGDEITLSDVFCDGLSTDSIVSSISDTWEKMKIDFDYVSFLPDKIIKIWKHN